MIHLPREGLYVPSVFHSAELKRQKRKARAFYASPPHARLQKRFDWATTWKLLGSAQDELLKTFKNKCVFCETQVGVPSLGRALASLHSDSSGEYFCHFRPIRGAINHNGELAPDHYWWLAFEWSNTIVACHGCKVAKGNRFPVEDSRAPMMARGATLQREGALLLDPCVDRPNDHLYFDDSGQVMGRSKRGNTTIEVLALNREDLVKRRRDALLLLDNAIMVVRARRHANKRDEVISFIRSLLTPESAFQGALRQHLFRSIHDGRLATALPVHEPWLAALADWIPASGSWLSDDRDAARLRIEATTRLSESDQESVVDHVQDQSAYYLGARRIERVEIFNLKAIKSLEITLPPPTTTQESCLALVGENGVGKSSVLQAMALALMGQKCADRMELDARKFVRHGQQSGGVLVHLTNANTVELRFSTKSRRFKVTPPEPLVLLLGYGATRLLQRARPSERLSRYIRARSLFDPFARMQLVEQWLTDVRIVNDCQFDRVSVALKDLLLLSPSDNIVRNDRTVFVEKGGDKCTLSELSDGFQSVVALVGDMMSVLLQKWPTMENAEGLVLVDELEAHLHPRWKLEIVSRLRRCFPRLCFLFTTHDPLCLRGLYPGEIVVLRRDQDGAVGSEVVRSSIDHLRADQLLTSPIFGLTHTRAVSFEQGVTRYARLMSKSGLTEDENAEREALRARLETGIQPGETIMQRRIGEAVRQLADHLGAADPWSFGQVSARASNEQRTRMRDALARLLKPDELR